MRNTKKFLIEASPLPPLPPTMFTIFLFFPGFLEHTKKMMMADQSVAQNKSLINYECDCFKILVVLCLAAIITDTQISTLVDQYHKINNTP